MLPIKFHINWPFISGEEAKNRFSRQWPSWILDRKDFSYFCSTRPPLCLLPSFKSISLLVQEKGKNRFSRQSTRRQSWISDLNDFSYFWYTSPQCFLPNFKSIGLSVQAKKRKIDFQDGSHFGFPIKMILAIFYLQVTPMLPTKFQVNWPFTFRRRSEK